MGSVSVINVFNNRAITKNASILLATPIYLGKCGPNTVFWADVSASGGGAVAITCQIGDTPDETFYQPGNASIGNPFKSRLGTASRDRVGVDIVGTEWIKFKADELNASPVVLSFDLIIAK